MKQSWFYGCLHFLGEHLSWENEKRELESRDEI